MRSCTWGRYDRAEATDVANAVLDGVDAVLLGAETLRGKYPLDTIRCVLSICRQAELVFDYEAHFEQMITSAMGVRPGLSLIEPPDLALHRLARVVLDKELLDCA